MRKPNTWALWSDTDDATVLVFSPQEAAELLGRSLSSVYHRRSIKDVGREDGVCAGVAGYRWGLVPKWAGFLV